MKSITLFENGNGWVARFENDHDIVALFGTDTIPTAFTSAATASDVLEAIILQNPEHDVVIG